jgi:hypothetical protein
MFGRGTVPVRILPVVPVQLVPLVPEGEEVGLVSVLVHLHYFIQLYLEHCTKNPIYVFPEMKLRGLVPHT